MSSQWRLRGAPAPVSHAGPAAGQLHREAPYALPWPSRAPLQASRGSQGRAPCAEPHHPAGSGTPTLLCPTARFAGRHPLPPRSGRASSVSRRQLRSAVSLFSLPTVLPTTSRRMLAELGGTSRSIPDRKLLEVLSISGMMRIVPDAMLAEGEGF